PANILKKDSKTIARCISALENNHREIISFENELLLDGEGEPISAAGESHPIPIIGITGRGGAGKSSLTDELVRRCLTEFEDLEIAVIAIYPSRLRTGGALLGDRIRMNSLDPDRVFMRSMATRATNRATSASVQGAIDIFKSAGF